MTTSDRSAIAWLHRRVGFGLAPGELDRLEELGVDAVVDRLVDPDRHGAAPRRDPWQGLRFSQVPTQGTNYRAESVAAIGAWMDHLSSTGRPTESWLTWFWHNHFPTAVAKVRLAGLMVTQLRLFQRAGSGSFAALLRGVTVDPAMLVWLDGRENTKATPNENYGREVMELFALGVGHYTEADVKACAAALSGWKLAPGATTASRFVPAQHDARPQRLLGRTVTDVDSVVATLVAQPACPVHIAGAFQDAILGTADAGLTADLARRFRASNLSVRTLLRATIEAGLARLDGPPSARPDVVVAPAPWLAAARRATGGTVSRQDGARHLLAAGQIPMNPPNVGGWPGGPAWLSTSTTVARANLAAAIAATTKDSSPVLRAAASGDDARLADLLCRPEGFGRATRNALADARRAGGRPGVAALAVALASPDLTVA
ncbi:MAG: DUF1800 family protein [Actinobacteria bacterium]|nr:DUF1800 family protein [Actinomycetota bacterium]